MAKFKNQLAYMLALMASPFSAVHAQEEVVSETNAKSAGSEEVAQEEAKGSLSAGAIAAAVAAAAAIAE